MGASFERGMVLYNLGRYEQAAVEFRAEAADRAGSAATHAMLGLSLLYAGERADAEAALRESARIAPNEAAVHYAMACLALRPRYVDRGGRLGIVAEFLPFRFRARRRSALAHLRAAVALDPLDADFHAMMASCELDLEDWRAAASAARQGLAIDPAHGRCRTVLARALAALGRRSEADDMLVQALNHDPEYAPAHLARGRLSLEAGDAGRAAGHVRESLRINATSPAAHRALRQIRWSSFPPFAALLWAARQLRQEDGRRSLSPAARWSCIGVGVLTAAIVRSC